MIPFFNPANEFYPTLSPTDWIGPGGPACKRLEEMLCDLSGYKYCVLTNSGTTALTVAGMALELSVGNLIYVPAYGVISTINAFGRWLRPVLVDIDKQGGMDASNLNNIFTSTGKAVVYVRFGGGSSGLKVVADICEINGIPLIEDAACAIGQPVKHLGDAVVYSFSVPKFITGGQGGAVLFNDPEVADRAAALVDQGQGWRKTGLASSIGGNYRLAGLQAELIIGQLFHLDEILNRARKVRNLFKHKTVDLMADPPLYNIILEKIGRSVSFSYEQQYGVISDHPVYAYLAGEHSMARYWADNATYLPFGPGLTVNMAEKIYKELWGDD